MEAFWEINASVTLDGIQYGCYWKPVRWPPPWPSEYERGTPCPYLKLRCAGGREFDPRPGQYSRMSFSSDQVTDTVCRHLKMPFLPNSEFV